MVTLIPNRIIYTDTNSYINLMRYIWVRMLVHGIDRVYDIHLDGNN